MKKHVFTGLALTAALAGSLASSTTATAADTSRSIAPVSSGAVSLTADARALDADPAKALEKYWTAAAMKSAKPVAIGRAGSPSKLGADLRTAVGKAGSVAPTGSAAARTSERRVPGSYPTWGANHPTAKTNGKVYFIKPSDGLKYVCSASIVNSEGKSTVWTAGHCVSSNQQWHRNWIFVPAYKNGVRPWGNWTAKQLWTTSGWFYNNSDWANDVGAVIMNRRLGVRITDKLGGQGMKWNWPRTYVTALGYPHAYPFNGQRLYREDGYTYAYGTDSYMLNYMTGGSSGGPWLREFNGSYGYINGHNDYKYNVWPQYMFSPYYGTQVANLYNATRYLTS